MVRMQLPKGHEKSLGVEPETDCSSRLYAAMQSIGDSPILKQRRELRPKETSLFLILLLPILVPLFLLGWTLYYWGGR